MLQPCRAWAAEIGEVRIGDDPANPTITLQLSAVDTESILADADRYDNAGNRRRLIREILFNELGTYPEGDPHVAGFIITTSTDPYCHFDNVA